MAELLSIILAGADLGAQQRVDAVDAQVDDRAVAQVLGQLQADAGMAAPCVTTIRAMMPATTAAPRRMPHPIPNAVPMYGTNGWTADHDELLEKHHLDGTLQEVRELLDHALLEVRPDRRAGG